MPTHLRPQPDPFIDRPLLVRPIRVMRRMKRRNRWVLRLVLAVPFLGVVGGVVLTRSAVTRWLVLPQIEQALNMEVSADAVYIALDGKLVIERATFRLPDVQGPAGDFLKVARIEAGVDWLGGIQGGTQAIRGVRMTQPVVIVSYSLDDNTLNIGKLSLPKSSGKMALPTITATNAGIELAEHSAGHTTVLKHIQMDGWLDPARNDPDAYAFQLTENNFKPRANAAGGFKLRGTISADGDLNVGIENFSLDSWPDSSMPRPVRALFNELDLEGEVPRAFFTYDQRQGLSARLELRGVGMDVPVQPAELTTIPEGDEAPQVLVGPPPRQLRMHGVSGFVTFARDEVYANVRGMAENLPYAVTLRYKGVTADAPFTCELVSNNFRVDRQPRLLPFAPKVVKERLQTFSSPIATVTTRLKVSRGEPANGEPGPISLSGQVELRDGVAAFEGFPYEFKDIHGIFRFDNNGLEWVNVTGRSASGAELSAHGIIAPLHEDAQADIYVSVRNAPVDEAMQNAFGKGRSDIIDALFSQKRYDELRAAGFIQSPEEHAAARRALDEARQRTASPEELAGLERRARVPVFAFRGTTDVDVHVHRPLGDKVDWLTTVDIRLPEAGLIPEKFPLPIRATNIAARVVNRDGQLLSGTFEGLSGGRADVRAEFKVPFDDDADQEVRPEIRVDAHEMPLDALLINALPGEDGAPVKRILRGMGISGVGRGSIDISTRASSDLGFDADFSIVGARMHPGGGPALIGDVGGRLLASEDHVELALNGRASTLGGDGRWRTSSGPLHAAISADFPPADSPEKTSYRAEISVPRLRLDAPAGQILRVFSDAAAARVESLHAEHTPSGAADLSVQVASSETDDPHITVIAKPSGPIDFDAMGGRFSFAPGGGALRIQAGAQESIACEDLQGVLTYDAAPLGRITLTGTAETGINAALRDGILESPLIARLAAERIDSDLWQALRPRGRFDADLILSRGQDGALETRGSITPRALTLRAGAQDLAFDRILGSIDFGAGMGSIRQLALFAPLWSTTISATWNALAGAGIDAHAEFGIRGDRFSPDLEALLPPEISGVLGEIGLQVAGPFELKSGSLSLRRGEQNTTRFSGTVEVEEASLDIGAELEHLAGAATISFERQDESAPVFDILATADRFEAAGIAMNSGFASVRSGQRKGEILVPEATALAHGGRIVVDARVMPGEDGSSDQKRTFFATLNAAGIRLAPLLKDLESKGVAMGVDTEDDRSRGVVEATMFLQGIVGEPSSRRGRGGFHIYNGRIVNVPLMMRMIELSNLQLPTNERLDQAHGRFFMDGPRITFEDLGLFSSAVQILGSGTLDWPTRRLDLRFDTKPARSIPLLSNLVRGIRDGLVTTLVTGTLEDPEIKLQQFPGARRILGRGAAPGTDEPPVEAPQSSAAAPQGPSEGIRPTRARRELE